MNTNNSSSRFLGMIFLTALISTGVLLAEPALRWDYKLTGRELSYFARCALMKEETSWMWADGQETIQIGENKLGTLLGGAQHIRYSYLPACIADYANMDYSVGNRDHYHGLAELSGLPIYQERQGSQQFSEEVNYYNPALIDWIRENMIPDPTTPLTLDASFQRLYDVAARRNARILAYTLYELRRSGDFAKYYEKYKNGDSVARIEMKHSILGDSPLQDAFSTEENDPYSYSFDPGHAATFWFRREMDGTSDEVLNLLKAVFQKYDAEALRQMK